MSKVLIRMRRRWASVALAIAALLGVSACGSTPSQHNSVGPTTTTAATSRTTARTTGTTSTSVPATTATTARPATTTRGPTTTRPGAVNSPEMDQLPQVPTIPPAANDEPTRGQPLNAFLQGVFNDIQTMWSDEFKKAGVTYLPATLRIFTGSVQTACGAQGSETGPFYCPADRTVYLDTSFFTLMEQQFGVTGDFAPAYVVAHEMGHHVQALLGITTQVAQADQGDPAGRNGRSVRVELQADCLAGVWAHSTDQRGLLKDGDLASALKAAAAVGDDFISKAAGQPTEMDNFTHGTSEQRQRWLTTGFEKGIPDACDTFSPASV